jgi:hypothetical protein
VVDNASTHPRNKPPSTSPNRDGSGREKKVTAAAPTSLFGPSYSGSVRSVLLAAGVTSLSACGSSPPHSDQGDRVVQVDGCDEHATSQPPQGDAVHVVTSCEGDRICQHGPRARLRDKLACADQVDEGAGKTVKTRPGPGPLHRRTKQRRVIPTRPTRPASPPTTTE